MTTHNEGTPRKDGKSRLLRPMTVLPVLLAAGFAFVVWFLFATQPTTQYQRPQPKVPVVNAMEIAVTDRDVTTTAQGVVAPANGSVDLRAQVGGDIVAIHPNFKPGGYIAAGELILQIDRTDYELARADARAALNQARASVEIEKGQQRIAEAEFELLQDDIEFDDASRALALRQPQLQRVEAEYQAAVAAMERAELNLRRTAVTLPYDVVVLDVGVTEGEYLGAREVAGTFARADEFWVELRVRHDVLGRLDSRSRDGAGSQVTVSLNEETYPGEVIRIRADVAQETRLGGVFIGIEDPLSMQPEHAGRSPLLIGSYVMAELDAGRVDDIIVMPRRALQDNNQVYVADSEDRLQRRSVRIAWELQDEVLIRPDLENGDRIITSRISGIAPGSKLDVRIVDGDDTGTVPATALETGNDANSQGGGPVGGSD